MPRRREFARRRRDIERATRTRAAEAVARSVVAPRAPHSAGSISTSVTVSAGDTLRQRKPGGADARRRTRPPGRRPRAGRGRQQDRIVADAVAAPRLAQAEPAAEHGVVGGFRRRAARSGPQLVAEPGILEQLARAAGCSSSTKMRRGSMPSEPSSTLMFWSSTICGMSAPLSSASIAVISTASLVRTSSRIGFVSSAAAPRPARDAPDRRAASSRAGRASPCRGSGRRRTTGTPAASGRSTGSRSAAAAPVPFPHK